MSVFGVDFGNLNSTVAITRCGGVDVVTNEVSKRETTTIVSFVEDERFIGEQALDRYVRNAQNTITLLKRFVGMRINHSNLEFEKRFLTCQIKGDENGRLMFSVNYCGKMQDFYPEQVLAMMLQKLRSYVSNASSSDPKFIVAVRDCVIAVPSYYDADQRRLIYQAAEVSGLNCMSLINESTAAAMDYGIFRGSTLNETEEDSQVVGILNIGYTTTEFSICRFWKGNCKILGRALDINTGTRDVDYELFKHMVEVVKTKYHVDVSGNRRASLRILQACERLKYLLSANSSAPLNVENIMDIDINIPCFERATLEELCVGVAGRVRAVLERGFQQSGIAPEKFHSIEAIGGGCRIPMFKQIIEQALGRPASFTLIASETTARGAAIMAAMLSPKFQVRRFKIAESAMYPVLLGYYIQNPKSPSAVPFLPDVNKVVTLLGANSAFPKVVDVKIPRNGPLKLYAFYDPEDENVKRLIIPENYVIGEWDIAPAIEKPRGQVHEIKVRINLKPDGLIYVEGAHAVDAYEVEEMVEAEPTKAEANEEAPAAGESTPPVSPAEPEKVLVKKAKQRLLEMPVTPNLDVLGHKTETVVRFCAHEKEMYDRDTLITATREEKNKLESYILEYRGQLGEGGGLADFVAPSDRQQFLRQCDDDEAWLYTEEGERASWEQYHARVGALQAIAGPAVARRRLREEVEQAFEGLQHRMEAAARQAVAGIGKAAHITEEELRQAAASAEEALTWGQARLQELMATPKTVDASITPAEFEKKASTVEGSLRAILSRPPPPPPKSEETPAPGAEKQNEEPEQAPQSGNEEASTAGTGGEPSQASPCEEEKA